MKPYDLEYLRKAIEVATNARLHGNHPFGAVLVDSQGKMIMEGENTVITGRDYTAHAETNLVRKAGAAFTAKELSGCTLYASTEPCAMCSGAIFWAGISRVVFGLSEVGLLELVAHLPAGNFLNLPCREVLARGDHTVEVVGPLLEDEARIPHLGFW